MVGDDYKEVKMVRIKWFQEHTVRSADDRFLHPVEVWCYDLYKPFGPASFMPIEKIKEVCITCEIIVDGEYVLAVNPMRKKVFL